MEGLFVKRWWSHQEQDLVGWLSPKNRGQATSFGGWVRNGWRYATFFAYSNIEMAPRETPASHNQRDSSKTEQDANQRTIITTIRLRLTSTSNHHGLYFYRLHVWYQWPTDQGGRVDAFGAEQESQDECRLSENGALAFSLLLLFLSMSCLVGRLRKEREREMNHGWIIRLRR